MVIGGVVHFTHLSEIDKRRVLLFLQQERRKTRVLPATETGSSGAATGGSGASTGSSGAATGSSGRGGAVTAVLK